MLRRLLLAAVVTVVVPFAAMLAPTAANAAPPGCNDGIAIGYFAFNPASVTVGQTSTLTLVLEDCGTQAVSGSVTFIPRFTWAGTGQPPGCPVMDPVAFHYSIAAPGGSATETLGLGDPIPSCLATGIQVTANVYVTGFTGIAATATANLVIIRPTPSAAG